MAGANGALECDGEAGMATHPASSSSTLPRERVAVVAIHGVADQKQGDTARSVAALLVNPEQLEARYTAGVCDTAIIAVPALGPMASGVSKECDTRHAFLESNGNGSSTNHVAARPPMKPLEKALRQSARSDFQRPKWITVHPFGNEIPRGVDGKKKRGLKLNAPLPQDAPADAGIAFSDYLLFKAARNESENDPYETTRIRMDRTSNDGEVQEVDVYEMYWADLSRLSGAVPRVVAELFTMVFRLSRLGRDTVDQARRAAQEKGAKSSINTCWSVLTTLQIGLDWAFSSLLANFFLQLLAVGVLITAIGFAANDDRPVQLAVAWALPIAVLWWFCYRHARSAIERIGALAAGAAAVWGLQAMQAHWVIGLACVGFLALLCDYGLRVADARFPSVRSVGLTLMAATMLTVLSHVAWRMWLRGETAGFDAWLNAGMRVVEYLLLAIVAWWAVTSVFFAAWLVLGWFAARQGASARASVVTGGLGLFVSITAFLVLGMSLWALLSNVVEPGVNGTSYCAVVFKVGACTNEISGAQFLHERYVNSTVAFSIVAGLLLLLVAYMVVVLVPSVLAEIKAAVGTSQNLGRWLSAGYRRLDTVVTGLLVASVLFAVLFGVLLMCARFGVATGETIERWTDHVTQLSQSVLTPLVLGAASAAAALTAFGHLLSRYVPWMRAPLDLALDVDNHFREFPRKAIPRAQIFSRYVALLEHIAAQGYDRIVIVAHSQGTVISAELLRYMQYRARNSFHGSQKDRVVELWRQFDGKVALLTAGCPLRQLYAKRFPDLYEWVLGTHDQRSGPVAMDVGASRWINVYTSGDYVGRWLWCDPPPAVELVRGKSTLYDMAHSKITVEAEMDVCLGSGAHTHYFESSQRMVARCIDSLVANDFPDYPIGKSVAASPVGRNEVKARA